MDELDSYHCRCSLRVSFIPIDIYDLLDDNVTFEYFYKQVIGSVKENFLFFIVLILSLTYCT